MSFLRRDIGEFGDAPAMFVAYSRPLCRSLAERSFWDRGRSIGGKPVLLLPLRWPVHLRQRLPGCIRCKGLMWCRAFAGWALRRNSDHLCASGPVKCLTNAGVLPVTRVFYRLSRRRNCRGLLTAW